MPITFKTKSYADITMLNEVGEKMLKMMDFGNAVPGAIVARDIERALSNLQTCLDIENTLIDKDDSEDSEDEEEPRVALGTRAIPLLKLLESAKANDHDVSWR